MRRCTYLLVKQSNKRSLKKNPPKENGENSIISQCIVKIQNLTGRILVPPFQKQWLEGGLQISVLKSYAIFTGKKKCFPLNIIQLL